MNIMLMMQKLAQMQLPAEASPVESPAQKVLRLAAQLPFSLPQLESEAARLEGLLDELQAPVSELGGQLMAQLVEILEGQLDSIYGLLDGDEEVFQQALELLLDCDGQLRELEGQMEGLREEVPLTA